MSLGAFVRGAFDGYQFGDRAIAAKERRKRNDERFEWEKEDRDWQGERRDRQRTQWSRQDAEYEREVGLREGFEQIAQDGYTDWQRGAAPQSAPQRAPLAPQVVTTDASMGNPAPPAREGVGPRVQSDQSRVSTMDGPRQRPAAPVQPGPAQPGGPTQPMPARAPIQPGPAQPGGPVQPMPPRTLMMAPGDSPPTYLGTDTRPGQPAPRQTPVQPGPASPGGPVQPAPPEPPAPAFPRYVTPPSFSTMMGDMLSTDTPPGDTRQRRQGGQAEPPQWSVPGAGAQDRSSRNRPLEGVEGVEPSDQPDETEKAGSPPRSRPSTTETSTPPADANAPEATSTPPAAAAASTPPASTPAAGSPTFGAELRDTAAQPKQSRPPSFAAITAEGTEEIAANPDADRTAPMDVPEEERAGGAATFRDYYRQEVVPKQIEFLLANGQHDKAMRLEAWLDSDRTQGLQESYARAVHAASIGDERGFFDHIGQVYNAYDDGYRFLPDQSDLRKNEDGETVAVIARQDTQTGEVFTQEFVGGEDLIQDALATLDPLALFEQLHADAQAEAAARSAQVQWEIDEARRRISEGWDREQDRQKIVGDLVKELASNPMFAQMSSEELSTVITKALTLMETDPSTTRPQNTFTGQ